MRITKQMIKEAKAKHACKEAIAWAKEKPRTTEELNEFNKSWSTWAMVNLKDYPIDLNGLSSWDRAYVMARRPDCPIDLTGLDSLERAYVMAHRPDCPIDLNGLNSWDRAWVMAHRPDYKAQARKKENTVREEEMQLYFLLRATLERTNLSDGKTTVNKWIFRLVNAPTIDDAEHKMRRYVDFNETGWKIAEIENLTLS